jgi:hypothetical protein
MFARVFLFASVLLVPWAAMAEPRVGPHDGMRVENLPPVAFPTATVEENLPDNALAVQLEKNGFDVLAGVEWQRVALASHGAEERRAWLRAGQAFMRAQKYQAAELSFQKAQDLGGGAPSAMPELLYNVAGASTGAPRMAALGKLATMPHNPWAKAALWRDVLAQAEHGPITHTYGWPELDAMRAYQTRFAAGNQKQAWIAAGFGAIPGAGHMVEGDYSQGAMILLFTALFGLAFLSACRHRHYAYSFLLVLPCVSLWLNSPIMAHALSLQKAEARWQAQVAKLKAQIVVPQAGYVYEEPMGAFPANGQKGLPHAPALKTTDISGTSVPLGLPKAVSATVR